jgi:hypothetical protein
MVTIKWPAHGAKLSQITGGAVVYGVDEDIAAILLLRDEAEFYVVDDTDDAASEAELLAVLPYTDPDFAIAALTLHYRYAGLSKWQARRRAEAIVKEMEFIGEAEDIEMPPGEYVVERRPDGWVIEGRRAHIVVGRLEATRP